uniref:DNA (cytosine-5-)-methyltransferase n=1 Tax=Volvox carteri f. nagariensis TaxID=3068 RepID=Q208B6_VOLCA|nr:Met1 [Volvox carteri f. nagariensis]
MKEPLQSAGAHLNTHPAVAKGTLVTKNLKEFPKLATDGNGPAKAKTSEKGTKRRADNGNDAAAAAVLTFSAEPSGPSSTGNQNPHHAQSALDSAAAAGSAPTAGGRAAADIGAEAAAVAEVKHLTGSAEAPEAAGPKGKKQKVAATYPATAGAATAANGKPNADRPAVASVAKAVQKSTAASKAAAAEAATTGHGNKQQQGKDKKLTTPAGMEGQAADDGDDGYDSKADAGGSKARRNGSTVRRAVQRVKSYKESGNEDDEDQEEADETAKVKDAVTEEDALQSTGPPAAAVAATTGAAAGLMRSLLGFSLVDAEGRPEPLDRLGSLQGGGLFITGIIAPLGARSETRSKPKAKRQQQSHQPPLPPPAAAAAAASVSLCRVTRVGPVLGWRIKYSVAADPRLVLHTALAHYECAKPAASYRKLLEPLLAQVELAGAVHQALCTETGGRLDSTFEDVCCRVARTKVSKQYGGARYALKLNGRFILEQLAAMAGTAGSHIVVGADNGGKDKQPADNSKAAAAAAADKYSYDNGPFARGLRQALETEDHMPLSKDALAMIMGRGGGGGGGGGIRIATDGGGGRDAETGGDGGGGGGGGGGTTVDDDYEMACRLMAEEYAEHMNGGSRRRGAGSKAAGGGCSNSKEPYIQVREEEIADDYPEPKEYKGEEDQDEWDELILEDPELLGCGFHGADERDSSRTLDHFAIYNSDGFLTTLELVPMVAGLDANVNIFASGVLAEDTGDWGPAAAPEAVDAEASGCGSGAGGSGSGGSASCGGQRYFLTQIREWFVECGPEGQVVINIRTDVSWYRLLRPQKRYAPWFRVVQRAANVAVQILKWLDEQDRAARLYFPDVITRLSSLAPGHEAYIRAKVEAVERFVVVHGQVVLNLIGRHYKDAIRRCGFGKALRVKLGERRHRKLGKPSAAGGARRGGRGATAAAGGAGSGMAAAKENPVKLRQVRKAKKPEPMPATSTAQVRRIWSDYFTALDEIQRKQQLKKEQELQQQNGDQQQLQEEKEQKMDVDSEPAAGAPAAPAPAPVHAAPVAAAESAAGVFRLPKILSKSWVLTERRTVDEATGRTMYGAATCGDLKLTPGSIIRLGIVPQLLGGRRCRRRVAAAASDGSDDDEGDGASEGDTAESDDGGEKDSSGGGGGTGGTDAAAAAAAASARRWAVLTEGPFGLVQCIFTDKEYKEGGGGGASPRLQVRRLVHGRDTMLANVAATSELFLLDRTPVPAVPASRGGGSGGATASAGGGLAAAPGDVVVLPLNGRTVADVVESKFLSRSAKHISRLEDSKSDLERVHQDAERVAAGRPPVFVYRSVYCPLQGMFRELRLRDLGLGSYVQEAPRPATLELLPGGAGFIKDGVTYQVGDFLHLRAAALDEEEEEEESDSEDKEQDTGSDSCSGTDDPNSDSEDNDSDSEDNDEEEEGGSSSSEGEDDDDDDDGGEGVDEDVRDAARRNPRRAAADATAARGRKRASKGKEKQKQRAKARETKNAKQKQGMKTNRSNNNGNTSTNQIAAAAAAGAAPPRRKRATTHKGSNNGLRAFAVAMLWSVEVEVEVKVTNKGNNKNNPRTAGDAAGAGVKGKKEAMASAAEAVAPFTIQVRRFYRPEDVSPDVAYRAGWWDLYMPPLSEGTEETGAMLELSVEEVYGKCDVVLGQPRPKNPVLDTFQVVGSYDPRQPGATPGPPPARLPTPPLPAPRQQQYGIGAKVNGGRAREEDGRGDGEEDVEAAVHEDGGEGIQLDTLDIFAGCGGLSEGMHQAGVARTRWAIEYDSEAAEAYKLNNPDAKVFCNNCNVLLRAAMLKAGFEADCLADPTCVEAAAGLDAATLGDLPTPGSVALMMGGPPCQGYSGMNRFNKGLWSQVQNSMVMAYLSYCDFYRPRYFLLENVRNFAVYRGGEVFRLVVRTLLDLGYQVRFGILNAGHFGVPQSRKRTFIWAALPGEVLPEWPTPRHVFVATQLGVRMGGNAAAAAGGSCGGRKGGKGADGVKNGGRGGGAGGGGGGDIAGGSLAPPGGFFFASGTPLPGAPLRTVTVRDAIGDLPPIDNDAKTDVLPYTAVPTSAFQRAIRGSAGSELRDHMVKQMNELNLERCRCIPRGVPGADWRVLLKIVAEDPSREFFKGESLVPFCLPNTADRHNGWRGLYGRLDPYGHFPTATTEPNPMGKVGQVFHPDQDRIVSVRECARSQGFPDHFRFYGNVICRHRQVGNAVPPPLARALGQQLRLALKEGRARDTKEAAEKIQSMRARRQQQPQQQPQQQHKHK